mgnify:FL=1
MIEIHEAKEEDAAGLLAVYAPYVEQTAITFEYEVPTLEEFTERIRQTKAKYPYLVAKRDGKVLGYAYAGQFHAREAYAWAVETSIYVDESCKHMGIGGMLHAALEEALKEQGFLNMNACIAYVPKEDEYLTNNSVEFHAHLGYRMVGQFYQCGYKFGRWYDMVWMEKLIGEHGANPKRPF